MTTGEPNAPFFVDTEVIRLTRNGVWLSDDVEISHEPTRRLFAKILRRDSEGYFLSIGRETKRILVEDTAYFVQRVDGDHSRGFELWLNDETRERLDPNTLTYQPGRLTCWIKNGTEEAKFLHAPYFEVLCELVEREGSYWIVIGGEKVRLASSDDHPRD
jgi:hypothetical protein